MMHALGENGRDNARTPMQWSAAPQAGFTQGTPWIEVNPNYTEVNVEDDLASSDSVYRYYQSLIALRKRYRAIVHGDFTPVLEQHDKVFAYLRTEGEIRLMVVANFSGDSLTVDLSEFTQSSAEVLLSNSGRTTFDFAAVELEPYDAYMVELVKG